MKCTEVQKDIHLFDELDGSMQQQVMAHLNTCADCKRVFDDAARSRQLIRRMPPAIHSLVDSRKFTDKVMRSIRDLQQQPHGSSFIEVLLDYLSLRSVKYSMALLSIISIGFFVKELTQNTEPKEATRHTQMAPSDPVKLNTASFFQQFQKVKNEGQTRASISQCLIDCRHSPQADCSSCKTKYLNLIKHHEKI
jgi:hypothetical protein